MTRPLRCDLPILRSHPTIHQCRFALSRGMGPLCASCVGRNPVALRLQFTTAFHTGRRFFLSSRNLLGAVTLRMDLTSHIRSECLLLRLPCNAWSCRVTRLVHLGVRSHLLRRCRLLMLSWRRSLGLVRLCHPRGLLMSLFVLFVRFGTHCRRGNHGPDECEDGQNFRIHISFSGMPPTPRLAAQLPSLKAPPGIVFVSKVRRR